MSSSNRTIEDCVTRQVCLNSFGGTELRPEKAAIKGIHRDPNAPNQPNVDRAASRNYGMIRLIYSVRSALRRIFCLFYAVSVRRIGIGISIRHLQLVP